MAAASSPLQGLLAELLAALGPLTVASDLGAHEDARRATVRAFVDRARALEVAEGDLLHRFLVASEERVVRGGDVALFGAAIAEGDAHPVTIAAEALLATGRWRKPYLRLLNRRSGPEARAPRETYPGGSTAIAVHPDGRLILAHGATVTVWTRGNSSPDLTLKTPHAGAIYDLAIHPDGRHVFTGCLADEEGQSDGRVFAFDLARGKRVATFAFDAFAPRASFDLARDGRALVAAGGPLRAWGVDLAAKKPVAPLWVVDGAYEMVAFHPGGATVAAAKSDGQIEIRDAATGALVRAFEAVAGGTTGHVRPAIFADGRRSLWAFEGASGFAIVDLDAGKVEDWIVGHGNDVESVALSSDERRVLTASQDGTLRIWDFASGDCLHAQRVDGASSKQALGAAAFVDDDARVAVVSLASNRATVWDVDPPTPDLPDLPGKTRRVVPAPDGASFLSLDDGGRARVWRGSPGEAPTALVPPDGARVVDASLSLDGTAWCLMLEGSSVASFDVATGAHVETRAAPAAVVVMDADDRRLVLPGPPDAAALSQAKGGALMRVEDRDVTVYRLAAAGNVAVATHRPGGGPWCALLAFEPEASEGGGAARVVIVTRDGELVVWDPVTGAIVRDASFREGPPLIGGPRTSKRLATGVPGAGRVYFVWLDGVVRRVDLAADGDVKAVLASRAPVVAMRVEPASGALWMATAEGAALVDPAASVPVAWYVSASQVGPNKPAALHVLSSERAVTVKDGVMEIFRLERP